MAQRITVQLVDDVDGGQADETVNFALDGVSYEIDLSATHAAMLREGLAEFVGCGRRTEKKLIAPIFRVTRVGSDAKTVRAWAKANGVPVNDRGRIHQSVIDQFEEANA
jgi:hypothetical protein